MTIYNGAVSPRPRTVDDREVLAAVGRVVSRIGPARLTLADVAAESSLAPPTLVQRFGSKRGLLLAFAASAAGAVADQFAAARAAEPSPLHALVDALVRLADGLNDPAVLARHVALLAVDLDDPEFHQHAAAHARVVAAEISSLLADAAAAGELRRSDPTRLARALQVAYNGSLLTWAIDPTDRMPDRLRADLLEVLSPYVSAG
jgi:AcrR family transcriptional regulator